MKSERWGRSGPQRNRPAIVKTSKGRPDQPAPAGSPYFSVKPRRGAARVPSNADSGRLPARSG